MSKVNDFLIKSKINDYHTYKIQLSAITNRLVDIYLKNSSLQYEDKIFSIRQDLEKKLSDVEKWLEGIKDQSVD